ncbi:hypothetical protein AAHA92_23289 [Salvia divinorum]|uniref:Uncharacterized protein n=1 Tax=Salvia divinorum TaxID=28513 RepID=A0ABD1GRH8_SALDI
MCSLLLIFVRSENFIAFIPHSSYSSLSEWNVLSALFVLPGSKWRHIWFNAYPWAHPFLNINGHQAVICSVCTLYSRLVNTNFTNIRTGSVVLTDKSLRYHNGRASVIAEETVVAGVAVDVEVEPAEVEPDVIAEEVDAVVAEVEAALIAEEVGSWMRVGTK